MLCSTLVVHHPSSFWNFLEALSPCLLNLGHLQPILSFRGFWSVTFQNGAVAWPIIIARGGFPCIWVTTPVHPGSGTTVLKFKSYFLISVHDVSSSQLLTGEGRGYTVARLVEDAEALLNVVPFSRRG